MGKENVDDILQQIAKGTFCIRSAHVTPSTIDTKKRSIEAVLASEARISEFDFERGEVIDVILLVDGMEFADQIPFLDSHGRFSIEDQIGSISELRTERTELLGRAFFGRTQKANDAFMMAEDGHITDLSIGFKKEITVFVEKGSTFEQGGRSIEGPAVISLKTTIKEGSLLSIGADEGAKLRGAGVESIQDLDALRKLIYNLEDDVRSARSTISLLSIANQKLNLRS